MRLAVIVLAALIADVLLAVGVGRFIRAGRNFELDEIDRAGLRRLSQVPPAPPTTYQRSNSSP